MLAPTREELLRNLRAVGDPLRLRMLVLLAHPPGPRTGPVSEGEPGMCVSDLRARLGRAHALVSHHVQVLLRAGLIRRVRRGRWSLLQLDTARVATLGEQIASLAGDQFPGFTALGNLEPADAQLPAVTARVVASSAAVHSLAAARAVCNGARVAGAPSW
ncbi:MAG TPA: metalloregulator ArsR/SmtB family transcription factor [Myxococcaceae bacterium]|nr:metalloregulator ArsR/SmtB family transcription factor [Myxococcaceae bacterium]